MNLTTMQAIEKSMARRVILKAIQALIAKSVLWVNSHPQYGLHMDPVQFEAEVFLLLDLLRHDLANSFPNSWLHAWLS